MACTQEVRGSNPLGSTTHLKGIEMSLDLSDRALIKDENEKIRIDLNSLTEEVGETNRLLRAVLSELINLNVKLNTER